MEKRVLDFSWASLWKVLVFVLLITLIFLAKNTFLGLFLAVVLASGLEVPIDILERRRIPRAIGAIFVFFLIALAIVVFLYAVIPLVIINLNEAIFNIQKAAQGTWWQPFFDVKASRSLNDFMGKIVDSFISNGATPLETISYIFGGLSLTISVFILSFYLSVNRRGVERFIRLVAPGNYEETAVRILDRSRRKIGLWFRAQFILSLLVTVTVWGALTLLGVPYALILGVTAGILELIPFVGPIIAGAISVLVALSVSTNLAIYTLIAFLAIQQLESNVLVPLLMNRAAGLNPILVIISLLMGLEVGGLLGALIAVPMAGIFQEIAEEWERGKLARKASAK